MTRQIMSKLVMVEDVTELKYSTRSELTQQPRGTLTARIDLAGVSPKFVAAAAVPHSAAVVMNACPAWTQLCPRGTRTYMTVSGVKAQRAWMGQHQRGPGLDGLGPGAAHHTYMHRSLIFRCIWPQ